MPLSLDSFGQDQNWPASGVTSDEQLMRRVGSDDREAFEQLYDRHAVRAYSTARSVCRDQSSAEDAVQEGFLSIWRSRANYHPTLGSFQGWAMTIIRNRALDCLRRDTAAGRAQLAEMLHGDGDATAGSSEAAMLLPSKSDALIEALRRLPDRQAEVIALAFFGELSHTEIAKQLMLPEGTVKGRMRLGLEKLRPPIDDPTAGDR